MDSHRTMNLNSNPMDSSHSRTFSYKQKNCAVTRAYMNEHGTQWTYWCYHYSVTWDT